MIPKYILDWLNIIENMRNDNTYKLAFGRAIIESISNDKYELSKDILTIQFNTISEKMIKYYWNQLFYFSLKQSPYVDKDPVICQHTWTLIEEYKKIVGSVRPEWYDKAIVVLKENNAELFENIVEEVSKTLHQNVSWRFKSVNSKKIDIYEYSKKDSSLIFNCKNAKMLKEYGLIISKLLNYKWSQLLEKFNFTPKIVNKVKGISEAKLKRNNLAKYREILLKEHGGKAVDFYTGKVLKEKDISIDHVIPWSYMYSDDIWNLVFTSKSQNSTKGNTIPSEDIVNKLKERNIKLLKLLSGNRKLEMKEAIENNYVDKFYYQCRL